MNPGGKRGPRRRNGKPEGGTEYSWPRDPGQHELYGARSAPLSRPRRGVHGWQGSGSVRVAQARRMAPASTLRSNAPLGGCGDPVVEPSIEITSPRAARVHEVLRGGEQSLAGERLELPFDRPVHPSQPSRSGRRRDIPSLGALSRGRTGDDVLVYSCSMPPASSIRRHPARGFLSCSLNSVTRP